MEYRFYQDPGHGWLEVERKELVALGIADKVSSYSYARRTMVYLEEDRDAVLFLDAMRAAGKDVLIKHVHQETRSAIRSYASYVPGGMPL